ncbi:MAG: NDP-sugar synthase [Verrucomicrobiota bacterium]|nr:NDP-sugar synthase [Verrucomicrobiota bacterium]
MKIKAGIFAAGHGERMRKQSDVLKPLVKVAGQTLIERVLHSLGKAGASEVVILINEDSTAVRDHVLNFEWPFQLSWIVETTPTSMHSFLRVVETLAATEDDGPFLLSTVDTVAAPETYAEFFAQAQQSDAAVVLALTSPRDDAKPLLVRCESGSSRISAIGEAAAPSEHATAGIYAVRAAILDEAADARRDGLDALRTFLGRLLERGYALAGIPIADSIDVDYSADVRKAEEFLESIAI